MHYYLDGYNFLFLWHDEEESLEEARNNLIHQLEQLAQNRNHPITVVFDAAENIGIISRTQRSNLEIIYSCEGQDADSCLIELIEHSRTPTNATLVTSDRHLKRRARELGVKTINTQDFLKKASAWRQDTPTDPKESSSLGKDPLFDHYLKVFEERHRKLKDTDSDW